MALWRCGGWAFDLARPRVMGILNVTPDSFSDGGRFGSPEEAVEAGLAMFAEGADIVDVGGESTRPGADPVTPDEEAARVLPVVEELAGAGCVSIDTRNAATARAALAAGAAVINDVSGFRDPAMIEVAAASDCGVVVMHMLGEPKTMQAEEPHYDDVVVEVRDYLATQAAMLEEAGMVRDRIAIDPGIGFGKTVEHNLTLIRDVGEFAATGYPVVLGASRKSFIGAVLGIEDPKQRVAGSLAVAAFAWLRGAHVLRVHDVRETVEVLRMVEALVGDSRAHLGRVP